MGDCDFLQDNEMHGDTDVMEESTGQVELTVELTTQNFASDQEIATECNKNEKADSMFSELDVDIRCETAVEVERVKMIPTSVVKELCMKVADDAAAVCAREAEAHSR